MTDLTVYYDFSSPFCYVAVEIAARLRSSYAPLNVIWRPFEVIDYLPERGAMPQNPAFVRRAETAQVARLAREYDLQVHVPERLLNSNLALCAVEFAIESEGLGIADKGSAERLHRSLFEGHYRDQLDISDIAVVLDIALRSRISDDVADALRARRFSAQVAASRSTAQALGVVAVPTWLAGGYGAVGVPSFSDLERLLETAAASAG
jgi:predicted DsbA family dithiol-disulfide isomerase